ncbi:nucleolar DEAD-box protein required for synthesis of 60S ribosomal subunit [Dispira parvispora]|uniref:RNA helicase n=1 Tax=Dispira parvispora TaxID=1520584 RepID=A0A9W8E612_9FUNG|nr:nucleolar DEAD-box protein required for synthesis of 60S ribosomal subunit [Dispira parvispora]
MEDESAIDRLISVYSTKVRHQSDLTVGPLHGAMLPGFDSESDGTSDFESIVEDLSSDEEVGEGTEDSENDTDNESAAMESNDEDNEDHLALPDTSDEEFSDAEGDNDVQTDLSDAEDDDSETEDESEIDEVEEARKRAFFAPEEEAQVDDLPQSFVTMNLSRPILKGLSQVGFSQPTPIQSQAIPLALLGKDICGGAVTGSGKTAAFVVPILERLLYRPRQVAATRVLVLCPTRELAIQCHSVAVKLGAFTDIQFCLCVGGLKIASQEAVLRQRPDVVIATPGRLIDHIHNSRSFTLEDLEILVMDEADRMLEDGFKAELTEIVKHCPKSRQTMLFSATMTDNIDELIRLSLNRPALVQIDSAKKTAKKLTQEFVRIRDSREGDRPAILLALCRKVCKSKCIIFFRSKLAVKEMNIMFTILGLRSAALHGDLSQIQRLAALELFRDGQVDFLLATDVAARGLDIKNVESVINFNMPLNYAQYLHRVGRTARAGRIGRAITLAGEADRKILRLAIKNSSQSKVKHRVLQPTTVEKYRERIGKIRDRVKDVMDNDKIDEKITVAEMQLRKTENMLKHRDDIMARPAKTWFQSSAQKQENQSWANKEYNAKFSAKAQQALKKAKKSEKLSRRKARQGSEEDHKAQQQAMGSIRAAKKAKRPKRLTKLSETNPAPTKRPRTQGDKLNVGFTEDLTNPTKKGAGKPRMAAKKSMSNVKLQNKAKGKGKGKR